MAAKVKLISCEDGGRLAFHCPGCRGAHMIRPASNGVAGSNWEWNGSLDSPTISPSILVGPDTDRRCHSFVRSGCIQFLGDCWHDLKDQTAVLPDWDDTQVEGG